MARNVSARSRNASTTSSLQAGRAAVIEAPPRTTSGTVTVIPSLSRMPVTWVTRLAPRGRQPGQRALAAEQRHRLEQLRRDRAAGDRHPHRAERELRLEPE